MNEPSSRACDWCKIEPADYRYREIVGIAERGSSRIHGRTDTGRVPCHSCVQKIRNGVNIGQLSDPLIGG